MYGTSGTLSLCLFAIVVNIANAQDSKFINPGEATDEDVNSLQVISSQYALPVIMFEIENSYRLEPLVGLTVAEVNNGRIASGTRFYSRSSESQIFFCPKSESQRCLAPKHFEESEALDCDVTPAPMLTEYGEHPCGVTGRGTRVGFVYELCPAEPPYSYETSRTTLYTICFDEVPNRMLSVNYDLVAAALLEEEIFTREREIKFNMNRQPTGIIDDDYYDKLEAEITQKPMYRLQMLLPIEDMALATSRRAVNFFANYALQHGALTNLWDYIMSTLRSHAIRWNNILYGRITGVVGIPANEMKFTWVEQNQKGDIWITLMMDVANGMPPKRGLAVIMHNFLTNDYENQSGKLYIDKLCGRNFCVDSLKEKFGMAGTEGRCCEINQTIYNIFIVKGKMLAPIEVLQVENITYN